MNDENVSDCFVTKDENPFGLRLAEQVLAARANHAFWPEEVQMARLGYHHL
jgi:hypothetical protein